MIENICFNCFESNSVAWKTKTFHSSFSSRRATFYPINFDLWKCESKREQGCGSGGWFLKKQAQFWPNECLLIKNMTFIIYQRDIAMLHRRPFAPFPWRSLIYIKNYFFSVWCRFGVERECERVKTSPLKPKFSVGTARS